MPDERRIIDPLPLPEIVAEPESPARLTIEDLLHQCVALTAGMGALGRRLLKVNADDELLVSEPAAAASLVTIAARLLDPSGTVAAMLAAANMLLGSLDAQAGTGVGHAAGIENIVGGGTPGPLTDIATATADIAAATTAIGTGISSILTILTDCYNDTEHSFNTTEVP